MSRSLRGLIERDGPLLVVCSALVLFGIALRAYDLGFPPGLTWDEHHFVLTAESYLRRGHDGNDHPPLGKLLIAIGMALVGNVPIGWRIAPLCFGLVSVLVSRSIGAWAFRDRRAGWIAAAFAAADGFLISYSRTALLDGMLTTLVLLVVLGSLRGRSTWHFAGVGALIGAAACIKTSGVALGLPAALSCLARDRPVRKVLALGTAPVAFTGIYSLGLMISREPSSPLDVWTRTITLIRLQSAANQFTHPMTSHWYTWFLPTRPLTLRYDVVSPGIVRVTSTLGNVLLWWTAALVLLWACAITVIAAHRVERGRSLRVPIGRTSRALVFLFLFGLSMLVPWMTGLRDSYIYHYLPTYALALIMTAGVVAHFYRRTRLGALGFVLAAACVSAFYAPVWAGLPLTPSGLMDRLFLPMWR